MDPLSSREHLGDLCAGFNDIQRKSSLHAETLAPLVAASLEYGTAALGCHAGTEAVALGTLTSVRLIGALHIVSLSWFRATC